jgi:hypothetical protein
MRELGFFMKNSVFWDVAPCRFCVNSRFGGSLGKRKLAEKYDERIILKILFRKIGCFDTILINMSQESCLIKDFNITVTKLWVVYK